MSDNNVKHVVIAGAGPSGILLACLLLRRNDTNTGKENVQYKVTLIESRPDLGVLDPETELKAHKSWMLALAGHGLEAIRTIPELYEDYVADIGVDIQKFFIFMGAKEISAEVEKDSTNTANNESFIVDRNYVVAAMARYLNTTHGKNPAFDRRYETKIQYVDYENQRVLTRTNDSKAKEEYLGYDLLVGADGVRSTVREAMVKRHSDFEVQVGDIFQNFRAVHVTMPKGINPNAMSILPDIFPHMQGIALPEKDGQVNISIGVPRNMFGKIASELKSNDPKVVAGYVRKNFKAFELDDYDDFAQKWIACRWNRTGMVHCNFYHSLPCKIVLMGDAAHATSPSIGMGMNTALRDAQKFNELLDEFENSDEKNDEIFEKVLPQFSIDRVKDGNALSDLAYYLYCLDTKHQLLETLHMLLRGFLHKKIPSIFSEHPQTMIGKPKYSLAEVYQAASDQGIIQKHRRINDRIRHEHFEFESGMLASQKPSFFSSPLLSIACLGLAIFGGIGAYHYYVPALTTTNL